MVVRCSLLGHDFGAPEVERQREESGSEVVVTVEEYEECSRCGTRNVLSENTEVKTLAPEPSDEDADAGLASAVDDGTGPEATADERDAHGTSPTPAEESGAPAADEPAVPTDENGDPITDDAEILDDTGPDDDRERGQWPSADDVGPPTEASPEPAAWPEEDADESVAEDEPLAATAGVDAEPDGASGTARTERDPSSGIERAGTAPTPGESAPRDGVPTEFFCPRCDFVAPGDRGSLRPGDICPECRRGYLGERERRA